MLSNQTPAIDQSQRHHQRQQSTPIKLEVQHIPHHPITQLQVAQYQDASLLSPEMDQLQQYVQDDGTVGITNTGHIQQHYSQVAQQHSQARPGQQQEPMPSIQYSEEEYRHFQHQKLDAQMDSIRFGNNHASPAYNEPLVNIERSRSFPGVYNGLNIMNLPQMATSSLQPHGFGAPHQQTLDHAPHRQSPPRGDICAGDYNTAMQPNRNIQMQAPYTPPNESNLGYFPATPMGTAYPLYNSSVSSQLDISHFPMSDFHPHAPLRSFGTPTHSPTHASIGQFEASTKATIRPSKRPMRAQGGYQSSMILGLGLDLGPTVLPSPPQTAPLRAVRSFDAAALRNSSMGNIPRLSVVPSGDGITLDLIQQDIERSATTSPRLSSVPESPMSHCSQQVGDMAFEYPPQHAIHHASPNVEHRTPVSFWDLPMRGPMSPHATSMADLNLDATIEDTGITAEEVQAYISEQDPVTFKWTCMFEDCGKLFGRKENIKSHVQTHLNDRQFKCVHCHKKFVRQHDLKRHAQIHSGVKPYPCQCGHSFARHDALTRHRQRGICAGGFAGVVKKVAKRGRPRKERPGDEERADKSTRTKKRAADKSYASSESGTSESSFGGSPPPMTKDSLDGTTTQSEVARNADPELLAFPPSFFSQTPPVSPRSTGYTPSPRKDPSTEQATTPSSIALDDDYQVIEFIGNDLVLMEGLQNSPLPSQPCTPPELSHSSPRSTTHLPDLEFSGAFNNSEIEHSRDEIDHEMFNSHFGDPSQGTFDPSWNGNSFLDFDKDSEIGNMGAFNQGLDDSLFANNLNDVNEGFY